MDRDTIQQLEKQIENLLQKKDSVIIGIDGQCASGKTTLGNMLAEKYEGNLFHMDDFFLRPEQRTAKRFAQPGGNVDYERFHEEVILPLMKQREFSYQPYDCHTQTLKAPITVSRKSLNIVEGTYCLHPYNASAFDFTVCMRVDEKLQRERILQRNPALHEKFFQVWIPLEEKYFSWLRERYRFDMMIEVSNTDAAKNPL